MSLDVGRRYVRALVDLGNLTIARLRTINRMEKYDYYTSLYKY